MKGRNHKFGEVLENMITWKHLKENPVGRVVIHIYCSSGVFKKTINKNVHLVTLHITTTIVCVY